MKGKKIIALCGFFSMVIAGCKQPAIHFQIETDRPCQTMTYFGASDAWSMQFIGLWPEEKQNQIADWLFSTENDANGQLPQDHTMERFRAQRRVILAVGTHERSVYLTATWIQ